jgi:hypothetical protein
MALHLQPNLAPRPASELAAELRQIMARGFNRNDAYRQYIYSRAMAILRAPVGAARYQEVAEDALTSLARQGARWSNQPLPEFFLNPMIPNYMSNSNSNHMSNSNNSPRRSPPTANASVRKYAQRWQLKGPIKLVNLPTNKNNRTDPVSFHTFRAGQEAIRHQRRNAEGRVISTRYYLLPTIERLAGMKWNAIRRMHPNKVLTKGSGPGNKFLTSKHVPNVITRLPMYRRNLTLVKFKD